ncbi:MAG: CHAD domain-containing protein [Pseudomonadota bacterium]
MEAQAVKAAPLALVRSMSREQAFVCIAHNCLAQVRANEVAVAGGNIESLHQMRVGLRRLSAAFALFRDVLRPPAALRSELAWLDTLLGQARDWEVLAWSTLGQVAREQEGKDLAPALRSAAFLRAEQAHAEAGTALVSLRYARLMQALARWLQDAPWRAEFKAAPRCCFDAGIVPFARNALARNARRLVRRGAELRDAGAPARHRTRIAAKKVRYASEFFVALLGQRKATRYVAALADVQDALGWLNDVSVAARLLDELGNCEPALAPDAAFVRGYLAGRAQRDTALVLRRWKAFAALPVARL